MSCNSSVTKDKILNKSILKKPVFNNIHTETISCIGEHICGDYLLSDLLGELQAIVNDKTKLENDNKILMAEINELKCKNEVYAGNIEESRTKFEIELDKLQQEIKNNETHLIDNSKKCLYQQKKNVEEIKKLRKENDQLKEQLVQTEKEFTEKISDLECKIKLSEENSNSLIVQSEESLQKSNKYKSKLKYAVGIINELNSLLVKYTTKPESNTSFTQTNECTIPSKAPNVKISTNLLPKICASKSPKDNEDTLLSDIFFKSRSFCSKEIILFDDGDCDKIKNVKT